MGGLVSFKPSVLEDRGAWLLIKSLLSGSVEELRPVLDSSTKIGFRYPDAERLLEAEAGDTVVRLEQLRRAGILEGELIESIFTCSACDSPDVHPKYQCLTCSGNRLVRQAVVEHFSCGYLAPRVEFETEGNGLKCPSCGEKLEEEQRDYKSDFAFRCLDCKTASAKPVLVLNCYQCQNTASVPEMKERSLFVYRLNMEHRADIIHYLGYHPSPEAEKPSRRKHRGDLDDLDRRILNILQRDARLSFRDVARRLKVSDATVRNRVSRLQQKNVIRGFTTIVDPQQAGMEVFCLIQLEVDAKIVSKITQNFRAVDEVNVVMETGDRPNIILFGIFPSRDALNVFLDDHIRGQSGVQLLSVTLALGLRKYDWLISM